LFFCGLIIIQKNLFFRDVITLAISKNHEISQYEAHTPVKHKVLLVFCGYCYFFCSSTPQTPGISKRWVMLAMGSPAE